MKLAVSNIAWSKEEEELAAITLTKTGIRFVEVAPTKQWQDPLSASPDELKSYKNFWTNHQLEVVAMQSMLFNRPDLKIFESEKNRNDTLEYLKKFIELSSTLGARILVFGSPKNRQRGNLSHDKAFSIAKEFFGELGEVADHNGVIFCIEPNPPQYNCDFITNAKEGMELVRTINSKGIGLHLDTACMKLAGDDAKSSIEEAAGILRHFHLSAPYLEQVESREDIDYRMAFQTLKAVNYNGFVSIEMKPDKPGSNIARLEKAVEFVLSTI